MNSKINMAKKELVSELSESGFASAINDKKSKIVIVDFFAEWCMPCTMMAPVMERLAEANTDVKFCKINVDDASNLSSKYEISSIPCIVFFKDGKEVERVIGAVPEESIQEKIKSYL